MAEDQVHDTRSTAYAARLAKVQGATWKKLVPNPYRWWIRRLNLGFVLDVGCGMGRTLHYLDGNGVGVDHNQDMVRVCAEGGLRAFTPEDFASSEYQRPGRFDALISLHVLEHLKPGQGDELLETYLPCVRPRGRVVLVTPQERGFASDPSHTEFVDGEALVNLCRRHGLEVDSWNSFPLPRWAGRSFIYNEFNVVAAVPHSS